MLIALRRSILALAAAAFCAGQAHAIELQPFRAQAQRVAGALRLLGSPLADVHSTAVEQSTALDSVDAIQALLDPLCLATVEINAESRVKVSRGAAPAELIQQGWRVFLVKVRNDARVTAPLRVASPNSDAVFKKSTDRSTVEVTITPANIEDRWLDLRTFDAQPLNPTLSGLEIEYRIVELFSRDAGKREAKLVFDVGQGTQDLGFRSELNVLFDCLPATTVSLRVHDENDAPVTASFTIRDQRNRLYPSPARRLAPDLFFQDQIYRADGETVALPPGEYSVTCGRGPEYRQSTRTIRVPAAPRHEESVVLARWIKPADRGWFSGDHHVHAAGCSHYESPQEGIRPADMMRQILGEDLNVGCVLSWGPCWYFQKQFFQAKTSELSTPGNLMRYDVEVSGFPSSHAGHVCLLGLREDDYPGTTRIEEWPSWDLPILRWARAQGAVAGFAHSGSGLKVDATRLPTLEMPRFDGIGANEYVIDVTHGQCDFISTVDTPAVWELNIWYHTLDCGLTARISGETDFPCIYGERVGIGRSYVKLDRGAELTYESWLKGLRAGRCYVSDGRSHLLDFRVDDLGVGEAGAEGRDSVLATASGSELKISVQAAALLDDELNDDIRKRQLDQRPYWHVERARIADTDRVSVQLIVNGEVALQEPIVADGKLRPVGFRFKPTKSSWIALRIFPCAHTNPVFVELDGKPIRASRASARWCLDAVDVCWGQKSPRIRDAERPEAEAAFEFARNFYRQALADSEE